jgi:hypothetical protein
VAEKHTVLGWLVEDLRLGAQPQSEIDQNLFDRAEALEAIRVTASKLQKAPSKLTSREFGEHAPDGWTVRRVNKYWGRWQLAIDVLTGTKPRRTAAQDAYRRQCAGRDLRFEEPLVSVGKFLETTPKAKNRTVYDEFARAANQQIGRDGLRHLSGSSIMQRLRIPWSLTIAVAAGETPLAEAQRATRAPSEQPTWLSEDAPHDLVDRRQIALILGKDYQQLRALENLQSYPAPVLVLPAVSAWLREDIEAYAAGIPILRRSHNALRPDYLTSADLALRLGVTRAALRQPKAHAPKPTGAVGGTGIWYRLYVERWLEQNAPRTRQRRHSAA